jgi:membrane-associated protease RseP (regulator of RpoE activity)
LAYPPDDRGLPAPVPLETFYVRPPFRKFQNRTWLHVLLFGLTFVSTTLLGAFHYLAFISDFGRHLPPLSWSLLVQGLWYSLTILSILGAHEMGHYLMCRYYNVDASLPYFIPAPALTGTLGAVIKIREPFTTRTVLFDIGIGGPIAGFVVLIPALFWGLSMSNVVVLPQNVPLDYLGEPLLFQFAVSAVFGEIPAGHSVNMHPMVFAAWFGMLATALNLLPFGQLDGGHITYATLGRWSTPISVATVTGAVIMTYFSWSWVVMTGLMLVMLFLFGPRHPQVIYEYEPLPASRKWLALFALVMLIVCFTPVIWEQFVPS